MEKVEIRRSKKKMWKLMPWFLVICLFMCILQLLHLNSSSIIEAIIFPLGLFLFLVMFVLFAKRDLLLFTIDDEGIQQHLGNWKKIPWREIKRATRLGKDGGVFLELKNPKEFMPVKILQRMQYFTTSGKGITIYFHATDTSGKEILALIEDHLSKVSD